MFLGALISSFYLLIGSAAVDPAIALIQSRHLETPEGRIEFLNGDLKSFVSKADQLNEEILLLSGQITDLEAETATEEEKNEMLALGNQLNEKMGVLLEMLPMLQNALKIDEDFQEIDTILQKTEPLDESEKTLLMRVGTLCDYIDAKKDSF